jgi:hypothetical protein
VLFSTIICLGNCDLAIFLGEVSFAKVSKILELLEKVRKAFESNKSKLEKYFLDH